MSKTRGNVIDPLQITEQYGTDAVRMSMLLGAAPGTDIILTEERMLSARAFANKIWNAARFIFLNMERSGVSAWMPPAEAPRRPEGPEPPLEDRWIFSRLNECATQASGAIARYRYHEAAQLLWQFFWHEFCDWYLEIKKLRLRESTGLNADWRNLLAVFEAALRLLHPVMPFITEELWQRLTEGCGGRPASIALARYPETDPEASDPAAEHDMELLQQLVVSARNLSADLKLDPRQRSEAALYARGALAALILREREAVEQLAMVSLEISEGLAPAEAEGVLRSTTEFDLLLRVPAAQIEAQRQRIQKENERLEKLIENSRRQLADETFLARAPQQVVSSIRAKLTEYEAQLAKAQGTLARLCRSR
jgi:valyl-tRNA synthetase